MNGLPEAYQHAVNTFEAEYLNKDVDGIYLSERSQLLAIDLCRLFVLILKDIQLWS